MRAADLPALEPTDADLIDLLTLPWDDTQDHLERLLVEAGLIELRRAVTPLPAHHAHTHHTPDAPERSAA